VYVLVVAQSSSEVPEGLMNNPVYYRLMMHGNSNIYIYIHIKKTHKGAHYKNCTFLINAVNHNVHGHTERK